LNRCNDNQIIVDIGSGDAFLASQIAKRHPQSSVTAVDINYTPELMAGLTQQLPSNLVLTPSLETVASQKKLMSLFSWMYWSIWKIHKNY
jgi:tRNA A22 N-methylase